MLTRLQVGSATFLDWAFIFISHLRFRQGLKAQGISTDKLPWKTWMGTYGTWIGLTGSIFFLGVEFYYSIFPIGEKPSAENFFSNYITVPLFFLDYFAYKVRQIR